MSNLQFFSKEENERYSLLLSRQARGGSLFFFIVAAVILTLALLVYSGVLFINPDTDEGFLIVGGLMLMVACFLISIWFFDYRRRAGVILDQGYWMVEGRLISVSRRSENGRVLQFELKMPSGVVKTGRQAYSNARLNVQAGDSVRIYLLKNKRNFFPADLDTFLSPGKLPGK